MASEQRYLTQPEAAALCGCDYSTIKRHRERGHFPNLRRRDDVNGTYEIPLSDLIAARLWKPTEGDHEDVEAAIGQSRTERRLEELRLELERVRAEAKALAAAFDQSREEVAYLRNALHVALGRAS
ncbi:MAG: hypothetical protein M3P85_02710 [Actinomycetota bacterium]|nr:hypothetical protein [Actinomycetota bacterium]